MTRPISICIIALMSMFASAHAIAEPLVASISIDPDAIVTSDRLLVTIHGTYACGPVPSGPAGANYADIDGAVSQAAGRDITRGSFFLRPDVVCDGLPQAFEASVVASSLPFHGGLARANASLYVERCDEFFNCETARSETNVQIKIKGGGQ